MLDKLAIRLSSQISPDEAHKALSGFYDSCSNSIETKYFGSHRVYYKQQGTIFKPFVGISTLPKCGQAGLRLEFNPSRSSFNEVLECTSLFADPEMGEVVRLDHVADIQLPVIQLFNSILMTRKKIRRDWKGCCLEGFVIGKHPEQLVVYDKAKEQKSNETLTRVELRQSQHKCPIKKLLSLPDLIQHKPFEKIQFFNPDLSNSNTRSELKGKVLKELIDQYGMQGAFKVLNKHGNFNRDFKNEIHSSNNNFPNLDLIYQVGIKTFFGENKHG